MVLILCIDLEISARAVVVVSEVVDIALDTVACSIALRVETVLVW